jgi:hypothetical protein
LLSRVEQKIINELESKIYWLIPNKFESIELSPVNPLWLNSFLTNTSSKNVLWTTRMTEVVADSTTVMSLEISKRREDLIKTWNKDKLVNLCTSHRFLRTQYFPKELKFLPHFKIFAFATWWKKGGLFELERETIKSHLEIYLNIFEELNNSWFLAEDITFYISDIRILETLLKKFKWGLAWHHLKIYKISIGGVFRFLKAYGK